MSKKINAALKRAYFYFGIDEVVPYEEIQERIEHLKRIPAGESVKIKVNKYADEIAEYFDNEKRVASTDFPVAFARAEPRRSWEHYTDDFPEDIFNGEIEPVDVVYDEIDSTPVDPKQNRTKIYINDELLGYCEDPLNFTQEMREKRRNGKISNQMNITYYENKNEIYIFNDPGRARRPLIIVKNGKPLLNGYHLRGISEGYLQWDDLITQGVIEFLDAEEEENSYIAMNLTDLTEEHTHLEIDPATMLGICAGIIPFSDHNSSPRNTMEAGITKQALGFYASNFTIRTDTRAHLLHYLQTPIVKTRITDTINYDLRPSGQNFVVALMSYEGYNMEDAMVFNKASLERGLGRSSFFRAYETSEKRYAGGQVDKFEIPDKKIKGYRSEEAYRNLDEDGVVNPESYVESGDVLLGKTSPPRFLEDDYESGFMEKRRETSVTVRHGEKGIVDAVILTETSGGSRLATIRVRDTRQPELGDKFASRHGQKGVIGLIVDSEDMPFTEFGVVPDLIVNPHAFPSRMSIGQIFEMIAGKAGSLEGKRVDGTPFDQIVEDEIKQHLIDNGFESAGCESLYDGVTGERFEAEIFVGVAYYQRLHHMTTDKVYARSTGPVQVLTRQPTEGRAREGGLRFGEMERDALIAHGAAITLKERLLDESDKYEAIVCDNCGMLGVLDRNRNRIYCPLCGDVETYPVEISYAFKLFLDELKSLCIFPKLKLGDKTEFKKPLKKKSSFKPKPLEDNNTLITKTRLVDEEPSQSELFDDEKLENCIVCGKKLNKNQKNLCRSCARKQYASRIIKKLSTVVKPGIPFKKGDLKPLKLVDLQIKDYIWTLQEFDLIDIDNNKFTLKNGDVLNDFRVESGFDPIDFESISGLDKICKTCGKTLPLSKFYKTSDGYEDNCKDCKRLITAANYLSDVVDYIGFNKEFSEKDLEIHISNPSKLMGMIWSLQDNNLLNKKESGTYILSDKSKCLEFIKKYSNKFNLENNEIQQKSEKIITQQTKSKSKKKSVKKSKSVESNDEIKSKSRKKSVKMNKSNKSDERKQMDFVLRLLRQGKTKSEVVELTGIKTSKLDSWYGKGKEDENENAVYFYNEINKINAQKSEVKENTKDAVNENHTSDNNDLKTKANQSSSNFKDNQDAERKQMEIVIKSLKNGKSRVDAAIDAEIHVTKISSWKRNGENGYSENTVYFVKELKKIQNNTNAKKENKPKNKVMPPNRPNLKNSNLSKVIKSAADSIKSLDNNDNLTQNKIKINGSQKIKKGNFDKNKSDLSDKKLSNTKNLALNNDKNDSINNKRFNVKKVDFENEKQLMDEVLSLMRKGYSRVQAAQEAGIKIGQIVIWYTQGRNNKSPNTIFFYNQLNRIEKK